MDKVICFDFDNVKSYVFNLIVLEMGLNDVCDSVCDVELIVWLLVVLVELLFSECKI